MRACVLLVRSLVQERDERDEKVTDYFVLLFLPVLIGTIARERDTYTHL